MRKRTKCPIVLSLSKRGPKEKTWERKDAVGSDLFSSERERDFSLGLRTIRPSEFVGTRSKAALRDEAYV